MKLLSLVFLLLIVNISCYYDTALSRAMAYFSWISWNLPWDINNWTCLSCKKFKVQRPKAFFIPFLNLQGFVGYYPEKNTVFVSFRGTADLVNWLINFSINLVPYHRCDGCRIHQGFYTGYNGTSNVVRNLVKQLLDIYQGAKITVTGHSLGGALAVVCALDLQQFFGRVDYLVPFGSPRLANKKLAQFVLKVIPQTYRIVNNADLVTRIPPQKWGFHHVGKQVWYSPRGMQTYKICQSEDPICANSVKTASIIDHSPWDYQKLKVQKPKKLNQVLKGLRGSFQKFTRFNYPQNQLENQINFNNEIQADIEDDQLQLNQNNDQFI